MTARLRSFLDALAAPELVVTCSLCEKPTDDYTVFSDGTVECSACRERSRQRYAAMTGGSDAS